MGRARRLQSYDFTSRHKHREARWSKKTQLSLLWRELSRLNHFIWASSASVRALQGLLEVELPQVRDGIHSAAPQSGLSSHLTTQQFMPGKSFSVYRQPCILCNGPICYFDVALTNCGGPLVFDSLSESRQMSSCCFSSSSVTVLHNTEGTTMPPEFLIGQNLCNDNICKCSLSGFDFYNICSCKFWLR